jgi:hypothetical protein
MTVITIFTKMLKFSKKKSSEKNCEGKYWIFRNFLFVEMRISNLINELLDRHVSKLMRFYSISISFFFLGVWGFGAEGGYDMMSSVFPFLFLD